MLTQETAKSLGLKGKFYHRIETPSFLRPNCLWIKQKNTFFDLPKKHLFSFHKIGKTFGLNTERFIQYKDGYLFYYEDQKDKQCKGYCDLDNIYLCFIRIDESYLMHLTNGNQSSQFFFNDPDFLESIAPKMFKNVIQLNFSEKYALGKQVGKGSFSKVYEGRCKNTGYRRAIKVVAKKDKNGILTKSIVEQEKKIMGLLNSEYTCQLIQFFEEDQIFIFILEFIEGKDLMQIIKEEDLSIKEIVDIIKGILEGIQTCHHCSIIHRDLKPQNIIVQKNHKLPKLIDFGLSLYMGSKVEHKKFKRCGTMGYMAYQVIQNTAQKRKPYNYKCDIFSFGIIAHMLLLGYNPLKGKNYQETFAKNKQCSIELNQKLITEKYGDPCFKFLNKTLKKNQEQRYSVEEALNSEFLSAENIKYMQQKSEQGYTTKKQKVEEGEDEDEHLYDINENSNQIHIPGIKSIVKRPSNFGVRES